MRAVARSNVHVGNAHPMRRTCRLCDGQAKLNSTPPQNIPHPHPQPPDPPPPRHVARRTTRRARPRPRAGTGTGPTTGARARRPATCRSGGTVTARVTTRSWTSAGTYHQRHRTHLPCNSGNTARPYLATPAPYRVPCNTGITRPYLATSTPYDNRAAMRSVRGSGGMFEQNDTLCWVHRMCGSGSTATHRYHAPTTTIHPLTHTHIHFPPPAFFRTARDTVTTDTTAKNCVLTASHLLSYGPPPTPR